MSEQDKLESGKFLLLSKWKAWGALVAVIVSALISGLSGWAYIVKKNDLTFTNQQQKYEVETHEKRIRKLEADGQDRDRKQIIFGSTQLQILEMVKEMKTEFKDTNIKVGQDLEQIKNQTRRR